jgi:hypothetical protein
VSEILVSRQECQIMPHTQLCQQRIDGPDLNTTGSTKISQSSGGNAILAVWHDQRKGREAIDDLIAGFWARESLQQLLQNQASRHMDRLVAMCNTSHRIPHRLRRRVQGTSAGPAAKCG